MSTTGIDVTGLSERIQAQRSRLSPAGLRIAEFMQENPEATLFKPAAELGRLVGTSDATVVRTIKQLGYAGIDELRDEIRDAIEVKLTPVRRLRRSLDWAGGEPAEVLGHMLDLQADLVDDTRTNLSPTQFGQAVELLRKATGVFVYGIGPLEHIAAYFALRLERLGVRARSSGDTGFRLADALLNLTRHDVVVLLAYTEVRHEAEVLIARAHEVGAQVVLVTDTLGRAFGDKVSATLHAPVVKNLMVSSFTTTLLVADALTLALAAKSRQRSERQFEQLQRLRGDLSHDWT